MSQQLSQKGPFSALVRPLTRSNLSETDLDVLFEAFGGI